MGTTPNGLPYPESTDLVTNGATAIEALAEAVDARLLGTLLEGAEVLTDQTTTSAGYADLATVGPEVTVTIGTSGRALVYLFARAYNETADEVAHAAVAVSGASTVAAADDYSASIRSPSVGALLGGDVWRLMTGLSPGVTTFTAKYRVNAGTAHYASRALVVIPL